MRELLFLAYWVKPDTEVDLNDIETAVIKRWQPPLNLNKVDHPLPALMHAPRVMADVRTHLGTRTRLSAVATRAVIGGTLRPRPARKEP
jgi:hypothetical protein